MASRKLLCLHGTGTSSAIMRHQMRPLTAILERELGLTMVFAQAEIDTHPAPGIGEVFDGPFYSYFTWSDPPTDQDRKSVEAAYDLIYDMIEEEGPFEGVLGFSLGAALASGFLLLHAEKNPWDLPFVHFQYAIFVAAIVPELSSEEDVLPCGPVSSLMRLPTVHVLGKQDDGYDASLAFAHACNHLAWSTIVTHDGGHIIPREPAIVRAICDAIIKLHNTATQV